MRNLYNIIFDEIKNKYLIWKASLHVTTYLSKRDFIYKFDGEVAWVVLSMWMLIRANHTKTNRFTDEFKKKFNEAIIITSNMKLGKDNSTENRKKALNEWVDFADINFENGIKNVYAKRRVMEEGIDSESELYKKVEKECIENIENIIDAFANRNLKYVETI